MLFQGVFDTAADGRNDKKWEKSNPGLVKAYRDEDMRKLDAYNTRIDQAPGGQDLPTPLDFAKLRS